MPAGEHILFACKTIISIIFLIRIREKDGCRA